MRLGQPLADRRLMKAFIASRIPEDGCAVLLADGPEGELWVNLDPVRYGDGEWDLHWETDCPEAVGLREIYEYFRRKEMTWWEWQGELAAKCVAESSNRLSLALHVLGTVVSADQFRRPLSDVNCQGPPLAQIEAKLDRILVSIEALLGPKPAREPTTLAASPALTKKEVARRFQISTRTLDRWRSMGLDLGEITVRGTIRFDPAKIAQIISTQKVKRRRR